MAKRLFTDEELLNLIREKAAELGRIPTLKEVPHWWIIVETFGTWKNALKVSGLPLNKERKACERQILKMLKKYYKKYNKVPYIKDITKENGFSVNGRRVQQIFKKPWAEILHMAGIEADIKRCPKYTDEELLEQIKEKYRELGKVPKSADLKNKRSIFERFGTLNNAFIKAGIPLEEITKRPNKKVARYKRYTDQELLDFLKAYADEYDCIPKIQDLDRSPNFPTTAKNILKRFKRPWKEILQMAGIDTTYERITYDPFDYLVI